MARLPQAADLRRDPIGTQTQAVNVRAPNYGPAIRGAQALQQGVEGLVGGLEASWKAQEEQADYATKKALVDFRLQTEAELEEYGKQMQPGAAGFESGWQGLYAKRAKEFVKTLPSERQKDAVQASITANYERLGAYAGRLARKETNRFVEEGLSTTLTGLVGKVDRDPDAMREARTEARQLIDKANLSIARKSVLAKSTFSTIEKTSVQSRIAGLRNGDDYAALNKDLAGKYQQPEWVNDVDGEGRIAQDAVLPPVNIVPFTKLQRIHGRPRTKPIGGIVMHYTEGSTTMDGNASWSNKKNTGANYYIGTDGTIHQWAPDDVSMAHAGKGRGRAGDKAPNLRNQDLLGIEIMTPKGGKPNEEQIAAAHALSAQLAKKYGLKVDNIYGHGELAVGHRHADEGMTAVNRIREMGLEVGEPAPEGAGLGDEYAGPYNHLDPDERNQLRRAATRQYGAIKKGIAKEVRSIEANANDGYAIPEPALGALIEKVKSTGDPALQQELGMMLQRAKVISVMQKNPSEMNRQYLNAQRAQFARVAPTPEQREQLDKLEAAVKSQETMLEKDMLSWAFRSGSVPVAQLNMMDARSMTDRLSHAEQSSKQFQRPIQYFTEADRKAKADQLKSGSASIVKITAALAQHWGPEHASKAIQELGENAPQAVLVGKLAMTYADRDGNIIMSDFLNDYEAGQKLRNSKDFKTADGRMTDRRAEVRTVVQDSLGAIPQANDIIRGVADTVYEIRARRNGWDTFNAEGYRHAVQEALGQRKFEGRVYGGIEMSRDGIMADSDPVIVPHDVEANSFDDLRDMIKISDLPTPPRLGGGRPITSAEFKNARLVTIEPGKYYLAKRDSYGLESAKAEYYSDENGERYIFDFDKVRPMLKTRREDLFLK